MSTHNVEYSLPSDKITLHPNETLTFEWSLLPGEEPIGLDVRNFGKANAALGVNEPRLFSCGRVTIDVLNNAHRDAQVQIALRVTYEAPYDQLH